MIVYSVPARVLLVAQSPAPIAIPLSSRLAANLAGVERFLYGRLDALAEGVTFVIHVEAQPPEFFLHLQHFELASRCPLESATKGSKSPHSRQRMSNQRNQPSSWVKPHGIEVCFMSPPVSNEVGQGTISAAGRKRIAAAQRARWAKVRAGKKKAA